MARRNVNTMGSGDQARYLRELEIKLEKAERGHDLMRKQYEEERKKVITYEATDGVQAYRDHIENLKYQLKEHQKGKEALEAKVKQLETENAEMETIANDCDEHLQTSKQQVRVLMAKVARRDEKIEKLKAELEDKQDEEKRTEFVQKEVPMANSTVLKLLENLRMQTTEMREMILDAQDKIITKKRRNF